MKKSGFAKGVIWTLSIGIVLVVILATVGVVAYKGYTNASLEASYSRGDTETKIKIEKKDKLSSEIASVDKKQVKFNEDLLKDKKKLNFKESGPFYGIKENGRMVRGILKGFQNKGFKTDFYGLFTKNQLMWKGYSEIKYDDGRILYQYNEYKLDKNGKVIVDKDGIYQLVDSYLISKEDFAKVRKYIAYDLSIPFDLYDFEETQIVKKKKIQKKKDKTLVDVLEFENEYKKIGIIKDNLNRYNVWTKKIPLIKGGEKKIIAIGLNDKKSNKVKAQYYIQYFPDGVIEYSKILDPKNSKGNRLLFSIYPKGNRWYSEAYEYVEINENSENKTYGKYKNATTEGWMLGVYLPNTEKREWLAFTWEDGSLDGKTDLSIEEKKKLIKISKKYIDQAIKVKKLLSKLEKNYYRKVINLSSTEIVKKTINEEAPMDLEREKINKEKIEIVKLKEVLQREKEELDELRKEIIKKENKISSEIINVKTDEKYYALVIGNNNYEHLEKLDAAEKDAEVIADVLTNKYGFEVDLLLNADYDTTVNSLFKITNKLKKDDNLLIYYAGHGELDKAENRGYWLPVDASFELRSKWISNQRIVDRIKATKAKHVLLIADSCFSGTLMRSSVTPESNEALDEKNIDRLKSKKTRLVITSGGNEPVVDSDGGDHSLFALKLIDTLKNNNTVINSQMLFENIRRYVISNADQTPERALVHKTGHDGGDFLFFPIK